MTGHIKPDTDTIFTNCNRKKKRIKNALEFMTPCYLVLSQNSNPVIIVKTKKGKLLTHNPILFDSAINYHMIIWTILPNVFAVLLVFVGIVLSDYVFLTSTFVVKLWLLCIFNQYLYAVFWYCTHISQLKFTPHSVIFWNCMS